MTTLAFAELTGTQHKHVIAKTRKLLKELDIDSAEFSAEYFDISGKANKMFELDKDLSLTLAGQYEPKIAYHVAKSFNRVSQPETQTITLSGSRAQKVIDLLLQENERLESQPKLIEGTTISTHNFPSSHWFTV